MQGAQAFKTLAALALGGAAWNTQPALAEMHEVREPSSSFELTVDGETFHARPGETVDVSINGKKVGVSASFADVKELRLEHFRFQYPSYFKYGVRFRRGTKIPVRWSLEGQDADVTVFCASSNALPNQKGQGALAAWMARVAGDDVVADTATRLDIGQTQLQGMRYKLPMTIGDLKTELLFDAFEVPGDFGDTRYFLLLSDWDGENPTEEKLVRKLLRTTFTLTEATAESTRR